jgi:hypothetical protein
MSTPAAVWPPPVVARGESVVSECQGQEGEAKVIGVGSLMPLLFPTRSFLVQHVANLDTSKMCNQYGIKKGELFSFCSLILRMGPWITARVSLSPLTVGPGVPALTLGSLSFLPLQSDLFPRTSPLCQAQTWSYPATSRPIWPMPTGPSEARTCLQNNLAPFFMTRDSRRWW